MNCRETIFCLILSSNILLMFQTSIAQESFSMEINTAKRQINYADPLFVNLNLRFTQSRISERTGKPLPFAEYSGWVLRVQHANEKHVSEFPLRLPLRFTLKDANGLEYVTTFMVFCDLHSERKKLIKNMIFNKPGAYTFSVMDAKKRSSNTLDILVEPSDLGQKALSILSDPNDFTFLLGGVYEKSERSRVITHLKNVVVQCDGAVLAQMASARLGLEYFKEFNKKHPSLEKFKSKLEQGQIQELLFDQAHKYLSAGYALPDELPIRDSVLGHLVETEFINGNYKKAISLVDELRTKYPDGEYGRKASMWKEELVELQELQERELGQSTKPPLGQSQRRIALPVVVAAVAVGIALIGLILVLKKRLRSRSK